MINVNQLTSELRMMPDQALQRMAMMYKNDPYIFPMVISEDMARKKLRQAAQAQAVQPQPTVKDQALMSMGEPPAPAPGIAALQAPNLANMADGGIAGADEIATYAEGGNVVMAPGSTPSYQRTAMSPGMLDFAQHSEPVIRMAEGGVPGYAGDQGSVVRQGLYDPMLAGTPIYLQRTPETEEEYLARKREAELAGAPVLERLLRSREDISTGARFLRGVLYPNEITPAQPAQPAQAAKATGAPISSGRSTGVGGPQVGEREAYAAARAAQNRPPAGEQPPAAAGAPAFRSDSSLYSLDPAVLRKRAGELMPTNEYETAYNVQAQRELERLEGREAERERNKPKGKAKEGLEALLKKEGEGEAKELSDAKAFALINAGLAVAGGESPRALTNIAKGLGVGAKEYQAAVKDLKKAARDRQLMLADIEEARRLEARGDYDKAEDRKDKAEERRASIQRSTMQGIMGLRLNQDQIVAGFAKAAQEGGIRRDIAGMEAASRRELSGLPGQQERIIERLGGGDFSKGYNIYRQESQMPALFSTYEKLASDTTLDPMSGKSKGATFRARYPDFQAYLAAFEQAQSGGTRGAAPAKTADPLGIR